MFSQFIIFVLVATRISGLLLVIPFFGSRSVPVRIRALLVLGLAMVVTPVFWGWPIEEPQTLVNLTILMARELALGLVLGLGMMIMLASLQLAGAIVGQMSGMQLADIVNPLSDTSIPIFSHLLDLLTMAVFLAMGGHRQIMAALLDTFHEMPPGQFTLPADLLTTVTALLTQSFVLGIRAAAPVIISLLLSVLVMGLISRTLPQLNIIAVGFSFNSMVMLATLSISIGVAAWVFQQQVAIAIEVLRDAILPATQ